MPDRTCSVEACERKVLAFGLCSAHYQRKRKGKPLDPPIWTPHNRTCSIPGCDRPFRRNDLCDMHCNRLRYYGTTEPGLRARAISPVEKFMTRFEVDPDTGCWVWQLGLTTEGYSQFAHDGHQMGHRWSYEFFVGPIPEGHHLHHECHNRPCVNPDHLHPLLPQEHIAMHLNQHLRV